MPDSASISLVGAVLEVVFPDGARRYVRVTQTPFLIGRGAETGNHLQLSDRRISRNCAALVIEAGRLYIEDRGQRRGLFVNGEKDENRLPNLLTRIEHITSSEPVGGGLRKLNLLLEATTLLHSQVPLDEALALMID